MNSRHISRRAWDIAQTRTPLYTCKSTWQGEAKGLGILGAVYGSPPHDLHFEIPLDWQEKGRQKICQRQETRKNNSKGRNQKRMQGGDEWEEKNGLRLQTLLPVATVVSVRFAPQHSGQ